MDRKVCALVAVCGLAMSGTAFGQIWVEQGDAGDLPATAQIPQGSGPLTAIQGNYGQDDCDMFQIQIVDPGIFRATTVGLVTWDTQLFMFDANGRGVTHNDDSAGTLQSTLTGRFVTGPGIYYIAITRYNRDPFAGGLLIWNNTPFGEERAPDGPGAGGVVDSWTGVTTGGVTYQISLSGVEFPSAVCYPDCDTSTGPGILDIFDFLCFGNRFSAGDPYACDCDVSTGPLVCDIFDFLCFGNEFNAGCP